MLKSTHSVSLVLLALLAAPLAAQRDYSLRKTTTTVLGKNTTVTFSGANANKAMFLMFSLSAGPTSLKPLVNDGRSIDVGLEFLSLWPLAKSGTGAGSFTVLTPNDTTLAGLELHVQTLTGPGNPGTIDGISDNVVLKLGAAGSFQKMKAQIAVARALATPVRISAASSKAGEKFLIAGGYTGSILGGLGNKTSEIFDTNTLSTKAGPGMVAARALNTVTLLNDGRVLIVGGTDTNGNPVKTCEIYDPKKNTFAATGSMSTARAAHGAVVLPGGKVLVAGGMKVAIDTSTTAKTISTVAAAPTNTCEIFDPSTGKWSGAASFSNASGTTGAISPALVTLSTGKVLVAGGLRVALFFGLPTKIETIDRSQLYDPKTNKWTLAPGMPMKVAVHGLGSMVLADGRYLVTGGVSISLATIPVPTSIDFPTSKKAAIYDPKTNKWTALPDMTNSRVGHVPVQVKSGAVYVIGGGTGTYLNSNILKVSEVLNVTTLKWATGPNVPNVASEYGVIQTSYGQVILVGGGVPTLDKDIMLFFE